MLTRRESSSLFPRTNLLTVLTSDEEFYVLCSDFGEDSSPLIVRPFSKIDSVPEITELLHLAYAEWKDAGLQFTACDQDDAKTLHRLTEGTAWLAEVDGRLIGTIALIPGRESHELPYYRRDGLFFFSQFGIHPDFKGQGFGKMLYEVAETHARDLGGQEIACDTSIRATRLVQLYTAWGFAEVAHHDWNFTNYISVVLAKQL